MYNNYEEDNYPQQPGIEANSLTSGSLLSQLLGSPVDNNAEIAELEAKIKVKQTAYCTLRRNKNFKIFEEETIQKVLREAIKNPIYMNGILHPALEKMTASELALFQAGMQTACNIILTDLDKYTNITL